MATTFEQKYAELQTAGTVRRVRQSMQKALAAMRAEQDRKAIQAALTAHTIRQGAPLDDFTLPDYVQTTGQAVAYLAGLRTDARARTGQAEEYRGADRAWAIEQLRAVMRQ